MIIFKKKLRYVLYLIPTLIMSFQSCSPKSNVSTKTERVNELKYTETKIDVFFNDGTNKIFDLDVYDNYEIEINNGDLTYWKVTKETEGVGWFFIFFFKLN